MNLKLAMPKGIFVGQRVRPATWAAIIFVSFVSTLARALPAETDVWIRLASFNFVCVSNADEARTRDIARNLESLRAVLLKLTKGLQVEGGHPTVVYVFRDSESFKPYNGGKASDPRAMVAGYFQSGVEFDVIAVNASAVSFYILYHEYIHSVLARSFEHLPLWFEEGVAEFYSTFECDRTDAKIGRPVREHLDWLDHNPGMALKDLLAVTQTSKEYNEDNRRGAFYAGSWLFVHYLMMGNEARKPQIPRFLTAIEQVPLERAFASAFETDYDGMEKELRAYAKGESFPYTKWRFADLQVPDTMSSRPMPRSEVLAQLGSLLVRVEEPGSTGAETMLKAALDMDPGQPRALAGLAGLARRQGHREEAGQLYAKALERAPTDAGLLLIAGMNLLDQASHANKGLTTRSPEYIHMALRARELLSQSLKVEPNDPETLGAYGVTWVADNADPSPGIAALEKAIQRSRQRTILRMNLLDLYVRNGDRKKAQDLVDHQISIADSAENINQARDRLLDLDLGEADALLRKNQFEAALVIMRRVQGASTSPARKASIEQMIPKIEAAAERDRENTVYQEAVRLVRKGNLSGAMGKLAGLVKWCKDPDICPSAKRSLSDLRKAQAR